MKQREVFLQGEGNAWMERNVPVVAMHPDTDELLRELIKLPMPVSTTAPGILEIGCGGGARLAWLRDNRKFKCVGLDPSSKAVETARSNGIDARQGTAERLPFGSAAFDMVVFGFCLYLCDRDDLFQIAAEADRVLRNPGWLIIRDFYSPVPSQRPYHHREGLQSFKMDYRTLFSWHPGYVVHHHHVGHHVDGAYTDQSDDWVAISILRKNSVHRE